MKFILFTKSMVFLGIISFLNISCSADSDVPSAPNNDFSFKDDTGIETIFALDKGFIRKLGLNNNGSGSYDIDIYLMTAELSFENLTYMGVGESIYVDLNVEEEGVLAAGTYAYSPDRSAFTFTNGLFLHEIDTSSGTAASQFDIVGGTLIVNDLTNTKELIFDLELSNGEIISGHFNMPLIEIE